MTNNQSANHDLRPGLKRALELGGGVVAQVTADQLPLPTPCSEFNVEQLSQHSLGVLERIVCVGQGRTDWPESVPDHHRLASYASEWQRLSTEIAGVWADDAILGKMLVLPFAEMPGVAAAGLYLNEVLVHAWDLATAIGADVDWDQDLAAGGLAGMKLALPVEGRELPFDDVVPTDDSATPMEQLIAFVGRDPRP